MIYPAMIEVIKRPTEYFGNTSATGGQLTVPCIGNHYAALIKDKKATAIMPDDTICVLNSKEYKIVDEFEMVESKPIEKLTTFLGQDIKTIEFYPRNAN